eukprot:521006_1
MNLIKTCKILNYDQNKSTITPQEFVEGDKRNSTSYIVSDCDEELLILLEFKQEIEVRNITLYALPIVPIDKKNDDEDNEGDDNDAINASPPKLVSVYKTKNLNIDYDDLNSMKAHKTVKCSTKKLAKGQIIKLQDQSKNSIKFKKVRYLVIYIKTNQNDTEHTYVNSIVFNTTKSKIHSLKSHSVSTNLSFDTTDTENVKESLQHFNTIKNNEYKQASQVTQPFHHTISSQSICLLSQCNSRKNILTILPKHQRYISTVNNQQSTNNQTASHNIYPVHYSDKDLINDFNHFLFEHQHELEGVYQSLIDQDHVLCHVANCDIMARNHRDRSICNNREQVRTMYYSEDIEYICTQQLLDKIHCYFYHTFDIGLKLSNTNLLTIDTELKQSDNENVNNIVTKCTNLILQKSQKYAKYHRTMHKYMTMSNDTSIYSFGFRFYYWSYFKENRSTSDRGLGSFGESISANPGYTLGDLYVDAKFKSIKEEITKNLVCKY